MLGIILLWVLGFVLVMLTIMTYYLRSVAKQYEADDEVGMDVEKKQKEIASSQNFVYTALILVSVAMVAALYIYAKGSPWEGHLMEWMNIITRLMHITFGIAWIGASFYFVFLENALNRTKDVRDELAGNLWAIHGGGFYYLEKYKVAPKTIPKHLHWFKYEAYFTWLSGFCLLFVVYYFNASALLIDKNVLDITPLTGISIGVGSFIIGWIMYDLLCKSPLIKKPILFTLIGFVIAAGFAYFYSQVFSSRAAYIHFGAMIGSIMVANVFFVIIPAQKAMVKAAREGLPLNPQLGKNALNRSLHNNYFTLPVLFVMISNHFPTTFGFEQPWLILIIITLGTAGVKHYLNLREKGALSVWVLPVSVIILLAGAFISAPPKDPGACNTKIEFSEVHMIIQERCISCHSSKPTDDVYKAAPNGVVYDTPNDIIFKKDLIMQRVVATKTMPQNNKTGMTEKERDVIRCWIEQGASIK
ncbi:MAG: urate hydroxylase PuuD [Ferruginibacter sp.]